MDKPNKYAQNQASKHGKAFDTGTGSAPPNAAVAPVPCYRVHVEAIACMRSGAATASAAPMTTPNATSSTWWRPDCGRAERERECVCVCERV